MWIDSKTIGAIAKAVRRPADGAPRGSLPHLLSAQALFGALRPMVQLSRLADEIAYPAYRQQEVRQPLFIVANARSGTTFLHHLLSLDDQRFAPMKLHQTVFPAVTLQRTIRQLGRVDRRWLNNAVHRLVEHSDRFFFKAWEDSHPTGLNSLEEDETLFLYTLLSPSIYFVFPHVRQLQRVAFMDKLDEPTRQRLMGFYLATVKRHLYAAGGNRTLLNKSIWHPPRMRSMRELFPDARFVYLVRHPYQSIPSFLSFYYSAWKIFYPSMQKKSPQMRAMGQLAVDYYRHALEQCAEIPEKQLVTLEFKELIGDPLAAVERIYRHFDMPLSDEVRTRVVTAAAAPQQFKSRHRYSLEEFGLSRQFVNEQLGDLFDRFGYER